MTTSCIILAGGLGTRLRSVVADRPKCMAPIGDKPFLYYLLQYLHRQGITHAVLSLGYKAEQVINWCHENDDLPLRISFAVEPEPMGTGGGIMQALPHLHGESDCFIVNGDTFFDVPLAEMDAFHRQHHHPLTIALKPMVQFERYGSILLGEGGVVKDFREKQYCDAGLINGGIYLTTLSFLQQLSLPEKFSFEKEVLEKQTGEGNVYGYTSDTYFIDIGIPEDYEAAQQTLTR